jgi:hypothetical protein
MWTSTFRCGSRGFANGGLSESIYFSIEGHIRPEYARGVRGHFLHSGNVFTCFPISAAFCRDIVLILQCSKVSELSFHILWTFICTIFNFSFCVENFFFYLWCLKWDFKQSGYILNSSEFQFV